MIVFERLRTDFEGGRIFYTDPVIPNELRIYWDFQCYMRGEGERAGSPGALYLGNIQQFYERHESVSYEPDALREVPGEPPPPEKLTVEDVDKRITARGGPLAVVNDEAHHTHDEESEWNKIIRQLNKDVSKGLDRFAKLPEQFGFAIEYTANTGNFRHYESDFVVLTNDGKHHIVETKGLEDVNVANKDRAATLWCENTTRLTSKPWDYVKVLQTEYNNLQATQFADLLVLDEPQNLL